MWNLGFLKPALWYSCQHFWSAFCVHSWYIWLDTCSSNVRMLHCSHRQTSRTPFSSDFLSLFRHCLVNIALDLLIFSDMKEPRGKRRICNVDKPCCGIFLSIVTSCTSSSSLSTSFVLWKSWLWGWCFLHGSLGTLRLWRLRSRTSVLMLLSSFWLTSRGITGKLDSLSLIQWLWAACEFSGWRGHLYYAVWHCCITACDIYEYFWPY